MWGIADVVTDRNVPLGAATSETMAKVILMARIRWD